MSPMINELVSNRFKKLFMGGPALAVMGNNMGFQYPPNRTYPNGNGLVSLRFDDNAPESYTVAYPELVSRGLVGGFAVSNAGIDYGSWLTSAQVLEMQAAGMEIMCHSENHADNPADTIAFIAETVGAKRNLCAKGLSIYSFVQPGTWTGANNHYNLTTTDFYTSPEHAILRRNFSSYEAYIETLDAVYHTRSLPITVPYGLNHLTGDQTSLATMKIEATYAFQNSRGITFLFHPQYIGQATYISLADFRAFLDFTKAAQDAHILSVVWPSQQNTGIPDGYSHLALQPGPGTNTDTWIDQANPTTNKGTDNNLYASLLSTGRILRSMLRFDLSSLAGKTIQHPCLILHSYGATTPASFNVHRVLPANAGWTETGATWNKVDGASNWAGSAGCGTAGTDYAETIMGSYTAAAIVQGAPQIVPLDPTEFAAMVANNAGMMLKAQDETTANNKQTSFSSDYATVVYRPLLLCRYK